MGRRAWQSQGWKGQTQLNACARARVHARTHTHTHTHNVCLTTCPLWTPHVGQPNGKEVLPKVNIWLPKKKLYFFHYPSVIEEILLGMEGYTYYLHALVVIINGKSTCKQFCQWLRLVKKRALKVTNWAAKLDPTGSIQIKGVIMV